MDSGSYEQPVTTICDNIVCKKLDFHFVYTRCEQIKIDVSK